VEEIKDKQLNLQEKWNLKIGKGVEDNYSNLHPAIQNETVFVADPSGLVKALDKSSGAIKWEQDILPKSSISKRNQPILLVVSW
jgi:outer membrane protein assembly factor BamB